MQFNQPLVRTAREAPVDYAAIDPATRAFSEQAEATEWSLFGGGGWSSRSRKSKGYKPRVESFAFDPYTQTREGLYNFQRDSIEPRIYYTQTRLDGEHLGAVEASPDASSPRFVLRGLPGTDTRGRGGRGRWWWKGKVSDKVWDDDSYDSSILRWRDKT